MINIKWYLRNKYCVSLSKAEGKEFNRKDSGIIFEENNPSVQ